MLAMFNTAVPLLVSMDVWDRLVVPMSRVPKMRLLLDRVMTGARIPLPVRGTDCGLSGALSVIVMDPSRRPTALGVKAIVMMQLAPGARLLPQVLVWAKSPLATMLVMVSTAVPQLVSVIVCGGLVVRSGWSAKFRILLESLTHGTTFSPKIASPANSPPDSRPASKELTNSPVAMLILNIIPVSTVAVQKSVPFGSRLIANRVPRRFGTLYVRMGVPLVLNLKTAFVSATKTVPSGKMRKA